MQDIITANEKKKASRKKNINKSKISKEKVWITNIVKRNDFQFEKKKKW